MAAALAGCAVSARAAEAPRRIVSLNVCTDQLVLLLAEPERIAALSRLARDPTLSAASEEAMRHPSVEASAESVLAHDPDLVVAIPFAARGAIDVLERVGRRVLLLPMAGDLSAIRRSVEVLAQAIGADARGRAILADLDQRLAALAPGDGRRPTALGYSVGGLVSGEGSLLDAAMAAAGWRNAAGAVRTNARGGLALELLIARPPELLVLPQRPDDYRTVQADNLRHPALGRLLERVAHVHVPQALTLCGTPHIVRAVELLSEARAALVRGRP